MKLAEALVLRGDLQKRQMQLAARIKQNTLIQEGDSPAENPHDLLTFYEEGAQTLCTLIAAINHVNARTMLGDMTMTEALAERDRLRASATFLREIASAATVKRNPQTRSEIRFVATMDVAALQQKADQISRDLRTLDNKIQSANWTVEFPSL